MRERNGGIWSIVLAAGESTRMGMPKMLLPFGGDTMIGKVISNIRAAGIENMIVVLGAESEKISPLLEIFSVTYCINNNYREGMLSSVVCGINNLPEKTGAVLIFPGDQPLIAPGTISMLVNSYLSSNGGIFIPVCNGRRGHPLLIDGKYRSEIRTLDPGIGLRALTDLHPGETQEIETGDPGIFKDFDTYDEYLREITK